MYERISTELFSNLIDKINQIPNYSTPYKENPSLKEPQRLSQLLHLFNMDSSHKETFSKIFSHIKDYNLYQNLVKIMINIGTKYNSFSVTNNNSSLINEANNELLSLLSSTWNYFKQKGEYLKNMNAIETGNREFNEYEDSFLESVCFSCGIINIIILMFKKQFSILDYFSKNNININMNLNNNNINKINSNKDYIQMEINMLFIIHKNRVWLEHLITLIEQIFKFILSNNFYKFISLKLDKYKKKEKDGEMSKDEIIKKIHSYINYIIDDDKDILKTIFTVVRKYNSLNNINVIIGSIIPINDINSLIQRFFNIYVIFLMHSKFVAISSNEEQIYSLSINLINCLLNSKYQDQNYGVDFIGYFYGAQNFIDEIFDEVNIKVINGINELISYFKAGILNIQMPNVNILQNLENTLKDYIMYSMVTCYNKDSLCDCYMNCEKQKQMYLSYGLVRAYLILCKDINNSFKGNTNGRNKNIDLEKRRQIIVSNIFDDLLKELKKYHIELPVKMFLYKNYILQSIFVVLHMIVKLFYKDILTINNDRFILYNDISFIRDLSESINCYFFMLGNDILYYLKFPFIYNNNNKDNDNEHYTSGAVPFLRIIDESNPINYYTIKQTKIYNQTFHISRSNTIKFFPTSNPLNSDNNINININKENFNIMGNSSIFNFQKNAETSISSALFSNHNHNNNCMNENTIDNNNNNPISNNLNKGGYTIMPTNTFQSNIFRTETKRPRFPQISEYLYRYEITDIIDNFKKEQLLSLSKIGFEYKFENNHHYIYINTDENNNFNLSQIIYLGKKDVTVLSLNNSSLYNSLKNEPFTSQIIEQLYVNLLDGFDESNKGKNCENSLKYYDISFNMDFFSFVEKCKEFIL